MKVILFGATGMVGQGALRECLLDPEVTGVLSVVRRASGRTDAKLTELVHPDFYDFTSAAKDFTGYDACFFCLGVTSAGLNEAQYTRVTHDIAVAAASVLVKASPSLTFVFVSGAGSDSTGTSRTMWARVKGKAENALLAMPFKAVYVFRPAMIQPLHGITSRTTSYRILYALLWPLVPVMRALFPKYVSTTEKVGRAMLNAAKKGAPKRVLENADFNALAG